MGNQTITIRNADRNAWIDFVAECKKERKTTWEVLEPLLNDYLQKRRKSK